MSLLRSPRKTLKDHSTLILAIYLSWMLFTIAFNLLIPVLPLYAIEFDVTYGLIGLIIGMEGLGTLAGDVPAGMLLRRYGMKRTMQLGLLGVMISTGLLFAAQSVVLVIVLRFVAGFCRALYSVAQHTYLSEHVPVTGRGRAIAIYGGVMRLGKFIGPALGGAFALWFGLRESFLLFGVIVVLALLAATIFVPQEMVSVAAEREKTGKAHDSVGAVLRANREILTVAGTAQLFGQMIRAGRTTLIPLFAADILGLDVGMIGLIVSIGAFMDMLMVFPAGVVMDTFGRKFAIVPCFGIQALGMLMVPFTGSAAGLIVAECIMGLSNGLGSGSMMTLGADLAPAESPGEFLGLWRFIGDGGFMSAPLIVGAIADVVVLPAAALAMTGAGLFSAGMFAFFVPETLRRDKSKRRPAT